MYELLRILSYAYGVNEYRVGLFDFCCNTIWLCKLTKYKDY